MTSSPSLTADMRTVSGAGLVSLAEYGAFTAGESWQGTTDLALMAYNKGEQLTV